MSGVVLDAAALIAFLQGEPGGDLVGNALDEAIMSAVNFAETAGHFIRHGATEAETSRKLGDMRVAIIDATAAHAMAAAALLPLTRAAGLSLGDRFCLALAKAEGRAAMTADRAWAGVGEIVGVEVRVIR